MPGKSDAASAWLFLRARRGYSDAGDRVPDPRKTLSDTVRVFAALWHRLW